MKNLFNEKLEQFKKECKLINLKYEYEEYNGNEQWAIVTELAEAQLFEKYSDIIKDYMPFIILSVCQGEIINEYNRNNHKYEMRSKRSEDFFGYEDGVAEIYHPELINYADPIEIYEEKCIELENQKRRIEDAHKVRIALAKLKPIQRERLIKNKYLDMSSRQIAKEEGVNYSSVDKSIKAAIKNFTKFYEEQ